MGLRWTCGVRHNTEQSSFLLTEWKGSSKGVVAGDSCVLARDALPAHLWRSGLSWRTRPQRGAAARPCPVRGCSRAAIVQHKGEESSEPGQLSESRSKSCSAGAPWKGGSMSDIWLKHAVLQPSSASVWSPEYRCQLGSNLHWAWESGTLAVSLMLSSPLLHWFQICS